MILYAALTAFCGLGSFSQYRRYCACGAPTYLASTIALGLGALAWIYLGYTVWSGGAE